MSIGVVTQVSEVPGPPIPTGSPGTHLSSGPRLVPPSGPPPRPPPGTVSISGVTLGQ